jgi:hypothetical protein
MLANLGLLSRKAGMSRSAFVERYEHGHVPLIEETLGSSFMAYSRCYPLIADDRDVGFDALTQVWYANTADSVHSISLLSEPETGRRIADDEKELFDRARLFFFRVDELTGGLPAPSGGKIKAVCLSQPLAGDRDTFIQTMERTIFPELVSLGATKGRSAIQGSRRNYAIPDSAFQHNLYTPHTRRPPAVVTEIWFDDRNYFDLWRAAYREADSRLRSSVGEPIEVRQFGDRGPSG